MISTLISEEVVGVPLEGRNGLEQIRVNQSKPI